MTTLMAQRMAAPRIRRAFPRRDKLGGRPGRERSSLCETYGSRKLGIAAAGGCRAGRRNGGAVT